MKQTLEQLADGPGTPVLVVDFLQFTAARPLGSGARGVQRAREERRDAGRGPGAKNLDFSIFRNFTFAERFMLQFRAESFNLTNTPAFLLPSANSPALTIGNSSFGKLNSSAATGRQMQFGLKLYF